MSTLPAQVYPEKSIAVLPFVNMSADPENEYFSDGITEEIINALTKVPGLKVTARTSSFAFKNKNVDIRSIGQQLGVRTVLEGSVRKVQNNVRITAQLIRAENGFHLWSRNFDRQLEDIFAVQDEISLLIADQIRENFGHLEIQEHLIDVPTHNIQAYNLYLKGRYHHLKWDSEGITKGIRYYEESIQQDPSFALPYFGIGYSYAMRASWGAASAYIPKAEAVLEKGFRISKDAYLGYYAQATLSFWAKWDFKEGHRFYQQAMALNPSFTEAEEGLAELYTVIGYFEKAMYHTQRILRLNPLSPNHYYTKGNIHFLNHEYDAALESLHRALLIDPDFLFAIEMIQLCYLMLGDGAALENFLATHPQAQKPQLCRAIFQLMYPEQQMNVDLRVIGAQEGLGLEPLLFPWHLYLQIYLGHHDLALDTLEEAVDKHNGSLGSFRYSPMLEPLHQYPRFQQLVQRTFPPDSLPEDEAEPPAAEANLNRALLSPAEATQYHEAMTALLDAAALYLDPDLGLKTLAAELDLHPNKLSWLLNEYVGKNFNEYINSYRLEAFKRKALDPAFGHLTLLALAYESGFNSKTVFNAFFKKAEGMTPRAWVKAARL